MDKGKEVGNGYQIAYSEFWGMYQVSHEVIGSCGEFKTEAEAVAYCLNG